MSITISKRNVLCFILLLSPLEPRYFELNATLHRIYTIIMLLSAAYLAAHYIRNRIKPANITALILFLQAWFLMTTILNQGLVSSMAIKFIKFFVLCMAVDYYSNDISRLVRCLMLHFEIYIYLNLISYIIYPSGLVTRTDYAGGISSEWILGWHHYFKIWFIPALLVAWFYRDYFNRSSRCYLLTAAIIITESFCGASTGLTGAILYLLLLLIPWLKRILTPIRAVVLAGFLVVSIVFIQQYDFLNFLLSRIYSDNLDFSGRLTIWTSAIRAIQNSPLLGYGSRSAAGDVATILGLGEWASHCHNHILQIMFMGGIVALVLFILMIYENIKACIRTWDLQGTNTSRICLYAVFVYLIIGITEQYEYVPMYLILLLPYYFCIARQKSEVVYKEEQY